MKEKIIELLKSNVSELENLNINENTMLITSGYMESFDVISMLTVYEEAFGIELSLENIKLEDFDTITGIEKVILNAKKGE